MHVCVGCGVQRCRLTSQRHVDVGSGEGDGDGDRVDEGAPTLIDLLGLPLALVLALPLGDVGGDTNLDAVALDVLDDDTVEVPVELSDTLPLVLRDLDGDTDVDAVALEVPLTLVLLVTDSVNDSLAVTEDDTVGVPVELSVTLPLALRDVEGDSDVDAVVLDVPLTLVLLVDVNV